VCAYEVVCAFFRLFFGWKGACDWASDRDQSPSLGRWWRIISA